MHATGYKTGSEPSAIYKCALLRRPRYLDRRPSPAMLTKSIVIGYVAAFPFPRLVLQGIKRIYTIGRAQREHEAGTLL
jgi:hypothetical protein